LGLSEPHGQWVYSVYSEGSWKWLTCGRPKGRLICLFSLSQNPKERLHYLPKTEITTFFLPVKDDLCLKTPGVYSIPCECGEVYWSH
jgi:hypothetical protein